MRSPLTSFRHAVLGLAVAGALGFGATQVLASPRVAPTQTCPVPADGSDTYWYQCGWNCYNGIGYCSGSQGICKCGYIP